MSLEQFKEYIEWCTEEQLRQEKDILERLSLEKRWRSKRINERIEVVTKKIMSLIK